MERIENVEQLEDLLSRPTERVMETARRMEGDVIVLGIGGKMGPTLARMLKRALDEVGKKSRVIGVSRFSGGRLEEQLQHWGIETIRCDLLDRAALAKLPEAPNVIYMAGMKFGSTGQEALTRAMNAYLPGMVCERYPKSRIAAFSTGNVYGLASVNGGGSRETDMPNPVGEYAMSCLGRERIFEHFGRTQKTPIALIRLNYAVELRYGVLLDIARKVYEEKPIDVSMGHVNVIWQGDANAMSIAALDQAAVPARVLNVAGGEVLRVRDVAEEFGRIFGKRPRIEGREAADALLSNASDSYRLVGSPTAPPGAVMKWVADWVSGGGETLDKPTHFEARDGKF